ncbi:uncharacterized protein LOC123518307 isoform X1 [Portunus trituberculatus]|uniref:uncharacterized protein LOC123518307 isoform X1 n=2 Tax=Portunus trituberculatus TaxID=210409 RepID=UPI001E1CCF0A|nr:uncharacterized protein LOC123518307 isoform X1 [Portunus trituberculatus]
MWELTSHYCVHLCMCMCMKHGREETVFISVEPTSLSLPQVVEWAASLHWWEWLIMAKAILLFWVINITVILPSLYMQVMLYTDEMTSRHNPAAVAWLWEGHHLLSRAVKHTSNLTPADRIQNRRLRRVKNSFLHARRRRKR